MVTGYNHGDNKPEFIAWTMPEWLSVTGVNVLYVEMGVEPGSLWKTGYMESFQSRFGVYS